MTPNCIVNKIVAEFKRLEQEILDRRPDQRPQSNSPWTKEILTTLCKLGKELKYKPWAAGKKPNRVPDKYGNGYEILYDASWWKLDDCDRDDCDRRLISVPMVAESEWGVLREIEYDFQKLLIARAKVRVMVYDGGVASERNRKNKPILKRLHELVGAFNGTEGDTYLLIPYLHAKEGGFKFQFHQITYKDSCNPPEIKKL